MNKMCGQPGDLRENIFGNFSLKSHDLFTELLAFLFFFLQNLRQK